MPGVYFGMASLTLGWVQLAAIVGALQGLFLTGVLIAQRTNRTANRLLAALMVSFTIYLAGGPYYSAGIARAASDRSWRFTRRDLVHFVPVAIVIIVAAPLFAMSGAEKIALWERWAAQ